MRQYRLEKAEQGYRLALQETNVPKPAAHEVLEAHVAHALTP